MGYFEDKAYIDSYLSRVSNRYYTKSDLLQRNEARYLAEIKDLKKSIQFKGGSLGLILS